TATPQTTRNIHTADTIPPARLQPTRGNLYQQPAATAAPQIRTPGLYGQRPTQQNTQENSNVRTHQELVNNNTNHP
ncbi:flagellar basal body rod protein FlgG, partial [Pseudomonas syringae pv. tagetis]